MATTLNAGSTAVLLGLSSVLLACTGPRLIDCADPSCRDAGDAHDAAPSAGSCLVSAQCEAGLVCDQAQGECVRCRDDEQCAYDSQMPRTCGPDGACQRVQCTGDEHCAYRCDVASHSCVQCLSNDDCLLISSGVLTVCRADHVCAACSPADCAGTCMPTLGCVECEGDGDCREGFECGVTTCEIADIDCTSADDCPPDTYCDDRDTGKCSECLSDEHCPAVEPHCKQRRCQP